MAERDELHLEVNGLIGDTKQLLDEHKELKHSYDKLLSDHIMLILELCTLKHGE